MEVSNLASGLIGSLIGAFLGGTVTFLGQKYLADAEIKRRRIGIVKALVSELMQNGAAVAGVIYQGTRAVDYSTETWRAARFELAQFLPGKLNDDLDYLYLTRPIMERLAVPPVTEEIRGLLEKWLKRLKSTLRELRGLREYTKTDSDQLQEIVEEMEEADSPTMDANEVPRAT